jgi:MFS transporter, ACS family, D-galactonate transporter
MTQATAVEATGRDVSLRWASLRVVALLMLVVGLGHFNRMSISVAGTERIISADGITATRMGMVYTIFLIGYTLAMLPGGWLIDRVGARWALALMCGASAVGVVMTGVTGWLSPTPVALWAGLLVVRGLMGVVNSPLHPGSAYMVGHSIPPSWTSLANGLVCFAACVGIASTYLVFGGLMDLIDWPAAFCVSGGATFGLLLLWLVLAPRAEAPAPASSGSPAVRPADLLRDRGLICLTLSYAALGYFQYLFFYWVEYYFNTVLELTTERSRLYSTLVNLSSGVGMVVGGWVMDRAMRLGRFGHAIVPVAGLTGSAVVLMLGLWTSHPELTLACFSLAMGALGMCEGPFWTMSVLMGGRRGGTTAAFMNTGGNAGGLLAPVLTPQLSHYFGWQVGMGLASLVALGGAALWVGIASPSGRAPDEKAREDASADSEGPAIMTARGQVESRTTYHRDPNTPIQRPSDGTTPR